MREGGERERDCPHAVGWPPGVGGVSAKKQKEKNRDQKKEQRSAKPVRFLIAGGLHAQLTLKESTPVGALPS